MCIAAIVAGSSGLSKDNVLFEPNTQTRVKDTVPMNFVFVMKTLCARATWLSILSLVLFQAVPATVAAEERFYFVGGEVKAPKRRVFIEGMTLSKAIESAGGLTDFGNAKKVQLIRANREKLTINLMEVFRDPKLDVPIGPGDTINVPRKIR